MTKRLLAIFGLVVALGLGAPVMMAQGKSQEHHGNKHADNDNDNDNDKGWERRDGYEYRTYSGHDSRPPGWSHGKKTGWGNCGMPPGQAKKYGCRTYVYQGRPTYYYQDDSGRVFVRRPILEAHGSLSVH